MKLIHEHITLVYSVPKYVNTYIKSICVCGLKFASLKCQRYGKIHVECKTCGDKGMLRLTREAIVKYMMYKHPGLTGDLAYFLNSWERDQQSLGTP
jgi:hypothetical protein